MLTNEQIRTILTDHRYCDKKTDLGHALKTSEIDALCAYFSTCKTEEECNEGRVRNVADNVIRKRLNGV